MAVGLTIQISSPETVENLLSRERLPVRLPNLHVLRMFDAAARHQNFRLAAGELNLTQGAVAQQVRRLETDLGLFDRGARGLSLTETGRSSRAQVESMSQESPS